MKFGINGIVIDPYNEVDARRRGNYREDEHIRDFISSCKRFARIHDCTVWVVAHPTKMIKDQNGSYAPPTAYDITATGEEDELIIVPLIEVFVYKKLLKFLLYVK